MYTVLIIDDEEIDCLILTKLISVIGGVRNIQTFHHPESALEYLSQIPSVEWPSHIFIDVNLPVMNGFEFLGRYLNIYGAVNKWTKIFILTSSISHEDRTKAANNKNINEFLIKPIDLEKLREILK